jgi:anti-sigma regulatory factor (Ser/Thr protein kinase)
MRADARAPSAGPAEEAAAVLTLNASAQWIPTAQAVAENGAKALGLPQEKALVLTMAVEEVVAHLALAAADERLEMRLLPESTGVAVEFLFRADAADLSALNVTGGPDSGDFMEGMGLLLASRLTDSFSIAAEGRLIRLRLRLDRPYAEAAADKAARHEPQGAARMVPDPEPSLLRAACVQALGLYPDHELAAWMRTPGKVADMVAGGTLECAVAEDEAGGLCGVLFWHRPSSQSVAFFGPYDFTPDREAAGPLTREMIRRVARSSALGVFSEIASSDLPEEEFERLAIVPACGADGACLERTAWYRHLREDTGSVVWAHPSMRHFLEHVYGDLVLMREIREVEEPEGKRPERSVFAARLRRDISEAVLTPMLDGKDAAENLRRHVHALSGEGLRNIFVHLDLASGWRAALAGPLLNCGFQARLVLPHAGQGDVAVLQYDELLA